MKQGITITQRIHLENIDNTNNISDVIFTYSDKLEHRDDEFLFLKKLSAEQVSFDINSKRFFIPLSQSDTTMLTRVYFIEAQVVYKNNTTEKWDVVKRTLKPTLRTENVNGQSDGTESEDLEMELEDVFVMSGGTGNYNDLENKPRINSVELNGNKTSHDLGLVSTTDLQTALANYQLLLTVTGHGSLNNGTLNIDASKTWFGTDTSDRISDRGGDYDGIAVGDLYVVTINYQSIVKVVTSIGESQGVPYFDVKPVDNTIVSSSARPNNITDHQGHNIDLGCVWVDTTNSRVSILKSYTGTASETVFNWIDIPNASDISNIRQVPSSTSSDEGKFLRVNANGEAVWQTVPNAESQSY